MAYFNGSKEVLSLKTSRKFYSAGTRVVDFNDYYFLKHSTDAKIWIDVNLEAMNVTRSVSDLCEVNGIQVLSAMDNQSNNYCLILSDDDFETWTKYYVPYNVVQMEYDGSNGIVAFGMQTSSDKALLSIGITTLDEAPTITLRLPDLRVWQSSVENRLFEDNGKFVYSDGYGVYSSPDGFAWSPLAPLSNITWFTKFQDKYYYRQDDSSSWPYVPKVYKTSNFIDIEEVTELSGVGNPVMITMGDTPSTELRLWDVVASVFYVINSDESVSVIPTTGIPEQTYPGNYLYKAAGSVYRMFGYQKMYSSSNGIDWTSEYFDTVKNSTIIGNNLIIVTRTSGNDFGIKSSQDGVTWTVNPTVTTVQGEFSGWYFRIIANGSYYLYRSSDDYMVGFWSSQDGITWNEVSPPWTSSSQQLLLGTLGNTLHAFLTQNNITILRSRASTASTWQGMDPEIINAPRKNYMGSDGFGTIYMTENNWVRGDTTLYLSTDRGVTFEPFTVPIERNRFDRAMITKIGLFTYVTGSYYDFDTSEMYIGLFRTTNYTNWERIVIGNSNLQNATLTWCALTYDGKKWALPVVLSQFYQGNLLLYSSTDQINWNTKILNSTDADALNWAEDAGGKSYITLSADRLAQNDSNYLTVNSLYGDNSWVSGTLDGTTWVDFNHADLDVGNFTIPVGCGKLFSVFYYHDDGRRFLFSEDGVNWFDPPNTVFAHERESGLIYFHTTETEIFEYDFTLDEIDGVMTWQLTSKLLDYSGNVLDSHIIDQSTSDEIRPFSCGFFKGKHYVATGNVMYSSVDRITWTKSVEDPDVMFADADINNFSTAISDDIIVFTMNGNQLLTSTDLINWELKQYTTQQFVNLSTLSYSEKRNTFVISYSFYDNTIDESRIILAESSDLETWSEITIPPYPSGANGNNFTRIKFGTDAVADIAFIATTSNGNPVQTKLWELDGTEWTDIVYGDSPTGIYVGGPLSNVPNFVNILADINTNNTVLFCANATQES